METSQQLRQLDGHVHVLGDGSAGSGCKVVIKGVFGRMQARMLLSVSGLNMQVLEEGLDEAYELMLWEKLKSSGLDGFVLLAHDHPLDDNGRIIEGLSPFYVPNDYVIELARRNEGFIPACSIHPARTDALRELERVAEAGVRMIKLLPNCLNIDYTDVRYKHFWRRMADSKMILLTHTGGEFALPVINKDYASIDRLKGPLDMGVTVIAAHCGGRSLMIDRDESSKFVDLLRCYPNLYGDNSALMTPNRHGLLATIVQEDIRERIIHGSDFPIPVNGLMPALRRIVPWAAYKESRRMDNPFARDVYLKRSMGFDDAVFTRLDGLLKKAGCEF